jgi:hypothetical protein
MFAMAAAVALLAASSTQAASVKEIFEKYNLVGIFAWDCTRPPTKDNLYFVNRVLDEGHLQRDEMSGPTARDRATIIDTAVELTQGEISVSGDRDGVRSEIVWRLQENRARGVESTLGGKKLIAGGKWTSNGQEVPWVNKCDAPSTQTQSSPRSPQADSEDVPRVQNVPGAQAQNESVKAIFEKYNLLGVFAQDCTKPPKAVENWYYVNRLIDANHVQRDLMESPTTRKSVTIIDNAMETTPNGIFIIGTRDGKPAQGIWRLEKDRMVQWESALAGQQEISAGKWVRTGMDMPWLYRCGAPGQQSQIGGNTTASTPFVVPDPNGGAWVYFQGTDNTLWKVRNDGSQQSQIGGNTTASTPFVVPDPNGGAWVYFQGTDNTLWKVRSDGSQQSQIGGNTTASTPFVVPDPNGGAWVYFQGTDNTLWKVRDDGSQQSQIGGNTASTPFVVPDPNDGAWVYFQGTDKTLWKVRNDGSQQSQIGGNTASTPFVVPDPNGAAWVYFQGTDNTLWKVRDDGSQQSQIGGNTTASTPFVVPDPNGGAWVYFQGTDNTLWKVRNDGSQQSQIGGNTTASTPFVTPDGWVYFQGTDGKLWKVLSNPRM